MSAAADPTAARREWGRFLLLPNVLFSVALLGGLRVSAQDRALLFVPPPLVTLPIALLLVALLVRGGLVVPRRWLGSQLSLPVNAAHLVCLVALFFASAQALNAVLPERGLLHWLFAFFFLWSLWNDQFAPFDRERVLRSLAVLFGTGFLLKHVLLGSLYGGPAPGLSRRVLNTLLEGVTLGALDSPGFAPHTGYIAFGTLVLYVAGLWLLREPENPEPPVGRSVPLPPGMSRRVAGEGQGGGSMND